MKRANVTLRTERSAQDKRGNNAESLLYILSGIWLGIDLPFSISLCMLLQASMHVCLSCIDPCSHVAPGIAKVGRAAAMPSSMLRRQQVDPEQRDRRSARCAQSGAYEQAERRLLGWHQQHVP